MARLNKSIWNDRTLMGCSRHAILLYIYLSTRDCTAVGATDLVPNRWGRLGRDNSAEQMLSGLAELEHHGYVDVDHDTDEVLLLRFMHDNQVDRMPNVLRKAVRDARLIHSPRLRARAHTLLCDAGADPDEHIRSDSENRSTISPTVRVRVYQRDNNRCTECGDTDDLSLDHIHPWSTGGSDDESNLQTMCRSCNSSKGTRYIPQAVTD